MPGSCFAENDVKDLSFFLEFASHLTTITKRENENKKTLKCCIFRRKLCSSVSGKDKQRCCMLLKDVGCAWASIYRSALQTNTYERNVYKLTKGPAYCGNCTNSFKINFAVTCNNTQIKRNNDPFDIFVRIIIPCWFRSNDNWYIMPNCFFQRKY